MIDLGKHKLRFLETPHVHHWDSMMLFDETTKSVFPSDLFIQPGDQPPVVTENLGSMMCEYYREIGIFAHDQPVRDVRRSNRGPRPRLDPRDARREPRAATSSPVLHDGRCGRDVGRRGQ